MAADDRGHAVVEAAPAKVNLYLHLRGRRPDGYHLLDSLAVFPSLGDRIEAEAGPGLSLAIDGPFGLGLPCDDGNLVIRAALALARHHGRPARAALRLAKHLPVASGIGGGSADAAAALRALARLWRVPVPPGVALDLGADVPVCLGAPQPRLMAGIGERLTPAPRLPPFWLVLVNPGQGVPTAAVFGALVARDLPPGPPPPDGGFAEPRALIDWLGRQRNDLGAAAQGLCPAIGQALAALGDAPLARMSGSGATCFALWPTAAAAEAQAQRLRAAEPRWWVAVAPVTPPPGVGAGAAAPGGGITGPT